MDLLTLIHSEQAGNIQLVVNAKDLCDLLDRAMEFAKREIMERDEPKFYTREELEAVLHVSAPTIYAYRQKGLLPEPEKIGGRVLYDKAKVRDMLSKSKKLRKIIQ